MSMSEPMGGTNHDGAGVPGICAGPCLSFSIDPGEGWSHEDALSLPDFEAGSEAVKAAGRFIATPEPLVALL